MIGEAGRSGQLPVFGTTDFLARPLAATKYEIRISKL